MKFRSLLLTGILTAAIVGWVAPALAQSSPVTVASQSYVDKDGSKRTVDIGSTYVVPGDTITFVHTYKNDSGAPVTGFLINNPLAHSMRFLDSADTNIVVSTDGGKSFAPLGTRDASAVTHVRWQFAQPIPPGGSGKVSFRAIVR